MEKIPGKATSDGLIRVAIVGPESTGKTSLARQLAAHFNTHWVPEYAREYLDQTGGKYEAPDLLEIARGQVGLEDKLATASKRLLFCDTNLLVIKIWSEHKYHNCHPWILREMARRKYHLHLLCDVDLPWMPDPLREHPDSRAYFFAKYKRELTDLKIPFRIISGNGPERFSKAVNAVVNLR